MNSPRLKLLLALVLVAPLIAHAHSNLILAP